MSETPSHVSRVIGVEEHVWTPGLRAALLKLGDDDTITIWSNEAKTNERLLDTGEERLARMDAQGVDFQVLSITAPGTQRLQPEEAVHLARDANDFLANAVQRHPDRFAAFATLPTPDPKAAAEELYRCVTELKFVGAMLFPRTGSEFLDHSKFRPIFEVAAELKVPLYLHPALPPAVVRQAYYAGFGSATDLMLSAGGWAWHAEAGLAALRLILAGTFDRHPHLQLILGHWGEMLVSFADRANGLTQTTQLERPVLDYITGNIYATAGGIFSHRMLRQVIDVLGPDRIMFAVDDPFQSALSPVKGTGARRDGRGFAREFIETAPISDEEKSKLAHLNAERLLLSPV